jgi:hypothetical protein
MVTISDTHTHTLLCTRDQPVLETSNRQQTSVTTDRQQCPQWDSNTQSQQASGLRPKPSTARPMGSAHRNLFYMFMGRGNCFTFEICCRFSVVFSIIFRLFHNFIFLCSNNTFSTNHALQFNCPPW